MSADTATLATAIANELSLSAAQVQRTIELLDDGNTLPFIARYRKEVTQGLTETQLRAIADAVTRARELADRKRTILKTIDEQGRLTDALRRRIEDCPDRQQLEDLYLPYRPKRKTRASVAREKGLQPVADVLLKQRDVPGGPAAFLQRFVNPAKDVNSPDDALAGGCDIVAETWAEEAELRAWMNDRAQRGRITSAVKRGKKDDGEKFETYFDHSERVDRLPSHRFLAMKRGESEGILRLAIRPDEDYTLPRLERRLLRNDRFPFLDALKQTVTDCYKRLLQPAAESAVMQQLKARADDEAIAVFASNIRELLLAAPAGQKVTLGVDPGFRTGCKLAVVDGTGRFLDSATIFPTPPRNDVAGAEKTVLELIRRHDIQLIAIGNGTASRETDAFITRLLTQNHPRLTKAIVSEAGASVYSASEVAVDEYPDLDVTVRGAISIAHRLQDPLAELVKIDPAAIGVGQYQHDVNQTRLKKSLAREVESCVNSVGVDLNTASAPLLSHVAGIGPGIARNIVDWRDSNGRFTSRQQLLKVPKLGRKAFQQCAGFLRIRDAREPLDNSAVHPESYAVVSRMASSLHVPTTQLVGNKQLASQLTPADFVTTETGQFTVRDIIDELSHPGRDPRSEFQTAVFDDSVNEVSDLTPGMTLEGVITNVTHFGAFVDIGVHQDGLIHVSQLADHFVKDPAQEVRVGQIVSVTVLEVDEQ
ncbi:MAG: RNA-binding transcriptional accessory protein, partial [Planctomycetaceae bacterium]|nr:RNA-binding transcriptional accessory protein [Planctomycetaceae bacterium]